MSKNIEENESYWINRLELTAHPEGGYYKEIFRSKIEIHRDGESKNASTSIYYLLSGKDFSGFHRLKSDELWYFHKGEPIIIHVINIHGIYRFIELSDTETGNLQTVIEPNSWFAAEISTGTGFALVSCAVAPGFEFSEFEMADQESLLSEFPAHLDIIARLCR